MALTMPVGSVKCERSSSVLRRVHYYARLTMNTSRLTNLSLLAIESARHGRSYYLAGGLKPPPRIFKITIEFSDKPPSLILNRFCVHYDDCNVRVSLQIQYVQMYNIPLHCAARWELGGYTRGTATGNQLNALTLKMYFTYINTIIKADFS